MFTFIFKHTSAFTNYIKSPMKCPFVGLKSLWYVMKVSDERKEEEKDCHVHLVNQNRSRFTFTFSQIFTARAPMWLNLDIWWIKKRLSVD